MVFMFKKEYFRKSAKKLVPGAPPRDIDHQHSTVKMKSRLVMFFTNVVTKTWSDLKINVLRQH